MEIEENVTEITPTTKDINKLKYDKKLHQFIKKNIIKKIPNKSVPILIEKILLGKNPINIQDLYLKDISYKIKYDKKSLSLYYAHNRSKFEEDTLNLKIDVIKELKTCILSHFQSVRKEIEIVDNIKKIGVEDGSDVYLINKDTYYESLRKLIGDEGGDISFVYNFDKPDLDYSFPTTNNFLHRCKIQITSDGIMFDYPIEHFYRCDACKTTARRKDYEVGSTKTKIKCEGYIEYIKSNGEPAHKLCGSILYPDDQEGDSQKCYFYYLTISDGKKNINSTAISFDEYFPGYYDCVLYKINNPGKTSFYHIIDTKKIETKKFKLPKKNDDENYLITLQRKIDKYIKQQVNIDIIGLCPIKIALIIQTAVSIFGRELLMNIQVVGDPSTGKSTVFKYYLYFLNGHLNLSTTGTSVSVPGMRGTKDSINVLGKDVKIVTVGHLGKYHSIHIDEAGENKELIQYLKPYLLEANYSYDKAGSVGDTKIRTAHCNITENIDRNYLGQYRGGIRKEYKNMNIMIGEENKPEWDDNWDLHLPLYKYTNPYLHKIIKEKREELIQKQLFWIDGYELAVHNRFPFYFYLTAETEMDDKKSAEMLLNQIGKKSEKMELIKNFDSSNLISYIKECWINYGNILPCIDDIIKIKNILRQYNINIGPRSEQFYFTILNTSRILNKRENFSEDDYDMVRWFIEKINNKLDINETFNYKIEGPPDVSMLKEIEEKLDTQVKDLDDDFGLPDGEFE